MKILAALSLPNDCPMCPMAKRSSPTVVRGNVFAALDLEDVPEHQVRVNLAVALIRESRRPIEVEGLCEGVLAERIKIDPRDLSRLMNGGVDEFSQARLRRLLNDLGCEVEITVPRAEDGAAPLTRADTCALSGTR